MPLENHEMRTECAIEFEKTRGAISRLSNDKAAQAEAMTQLTGAIEAAVARGDRNHDETMRMVMAYQSEVVDLHGSLRERTALVEQSNRSQHKRQDAFEIKLAENKRVLWALLVSLLLLVGGTLLGILVK
jgi:hypothetical protein